MIKKYLILSACFEIVKIMFDDRSEQRKLDNSSFRQYNKKNRIENNICWIILKKPLSINFPNYYLF